MRVADVPAIAVYANFCEVGHNAYEFLIDFGQFQPALGEVVVHSRIVSGPVQAKLFARVLNDALDRYEREHGVISAPGDDDALALMMIPMTDLAQLAERARRTRQAASPVPITAER